MRGTLIIAFVACALAPPASFAGPFAVDERRAALSATEAVGARSACMAPRIELDEDPAPVKALATTEGYGSDQSVEPFSWIVMTLGGRALANDDASTKRLIALLVDWAEADAMLASEDVHDAHFAIKRALLPTIFSYSIVRDAMVEVDQTTVDKWIDALTSKIDREFNGDVDLNNHRYLADSALVAWAAVKPQSDFAASRRTVARDRLEFALLIQMRPDGSFPLEARRGARAIWYHRQTLASLSVIIGALREMGEDPLANARLAAAWDRANTYFLDILRSPRLVMRYAAENYIPGPSNDYETQDLGFLDERGHGRHYMAWTELALSFGPDTLATERLSRLVAAELAEERPLIDEFSGGNGTCFWAPIQSKPDVTQ